MGEFEGIANSIAGILREIGREGNRGISTDELPRIVHDFGFRGPFNCYPGGSGYGCHDLAIFFSLTTPQYKGKHRGHLTCRKAIEMLVQHMQGACSRGRTHIAVLIVDSWDAEAAFDWRSNLEEIQTHAHLEVYLLVGETSTRLRV